MTIYRFSINVTRSKISCLEIDVTEAPKSYIVTLPEHGVPSKILKSKIGILDDYNTMYLTEDNFPFYLNALIKKTEDKVVQLRNQVSAKEELLFKLYNRREKDFKNMLRTFYRYTWADGTIRSVPVNAVTTDGEEFKVFAREDRPSFKTFYINKNQFGSILKDTTEFILPTQNDNLALSVVLANRSIFMLSEENINGILKCMLENSIKEIV